MSINFRVQAPVGYAKIIAKVSRRAGPCRGAAL